MTHAQFSRKLELGLSRVWITVFCNAVGRTQTKDGRWITYGLAPGSPDIVGWISARVAVWFGCEVKVGSDSLRGHQLDFLKALDRAGGLACVVRCTASHVEQRDVDRFSKRIYDECQKRACDLPHESTFEEDGMSFRFITWK